MQSPGPGIPAARRSAKHLPHTGYKAATGEISYVDGSQIPSKSVAIVVTKDGKFELVKTTVPTVVPEAYLPTSVLTEMEHDSRNILIVPDQSHLCSVRSLDN